MTANQIYKQQCREGKTKLSFKEWLANNNNYLNAMGDDKAVVQPNDDSKKTKINITGLLIPIIFTTVIVFSVFYLVNKSKQ